MNVLLISRPGVSLLRSLHDSETAWDAIRFYEPFSLSIGVYIPVSTLAGAISLTSDLRFFLRKYTTDHLFQIYPGIFSTPALTRSRYVTRDISFSKDWPYQLVYWIENEGRIVRFRKSEFNSEEVFNSFNNFPINSKEDEEQSHAHSEGSKPEIVDGVPTGYIFEVWCTKPEFEMI